MRNILLASTSTIYGGEYLDYILEDIDVLFKNCQEILFIPFARPSGISHENYTQQANLAFQKINKTLVGLHTFKNKQDAIKNAKGIFVGGGNTFLLTSQLYKYDLVVSLKDSINKGTAYLGTSAGSNICGLTIKTTNDMPIVYPKSFNALGIVPFNINPHFIAKKELETHMGESRETRIKEFHCFNTQPVIGLKEGSWLEINNATIRLKGKPNAVIFKHNTIPYEVLPNTILNDIK